jgi:hypothetical protein
LAGRDDGAVGEGFAQLTVAAWDNGVVNDARDGRRGSDRGWEFAQLTEAALDNRWSRGRGGGFAQLTVDAGDDGAWARVHATAGRHDGGVTEAGDSWN